MDAARDLTDREIRRLEHEATLGYGRVGDSAASALTEYLRSTASEDGTVPESALRGREWAEVRRSLAQSITDQNAATVGAVSDRVPALRDLTAGGAPPASEVPRPTLDRARDLRWNERHVESVARSAVGRPPEHAGAGMRGLADMNRRSAMRSARTAVNGAENAGRLDAMLALGGSKRWVAVMDSRTRASHADLNGEVRPVDEPFSNGLMYPSDPSGPPEEVYNCRCSIEWVDTSETSEAADTWRPEDIGTMPQRPRQEDFSDYDEYLEARTAYRQSRREFTDRKESLIDEITARPSHGFDTEASVREWAGRAGVDVMDDVFRSVDIRVVDDAVHTLDSLMSQYPQVTESFDRYGSRFRISVSHDSGVFMEARGGLAINPSMTSDYRDAITHVVDGYTNSTYSDAVGRDLLWQVRGDGTLQTIVTHEFGHNLDSAIRDSMDTDQILQYNRELAELTRAHTVSEYSLTNTDEAFAEAFAEYVCNPSSKYAEAFGEFLKRWM